ncbi:MAG: 50S ribosomal protein L9 [Gammaproteobacteria bacterium RIFCSPHIGHO2_12_FULL_42_13]|nr:MAG: 50S ribosomal protein L9 [Gammaproteobacteria bacterium RIFCSPHIGHO2_12_FULL_42_13]
MKVILQERVGNLGNVGDQVNVRRGFARNYLLPRGKAVQATQNNILAFEARRAELEKRAADVLSEAQKRAGQFEACVLNLSVQASEEGKLFGSVGPRDIAKAAHSSGKPLEKSEIEMPEGPIRTVGEYTVTVQLHSEVHVKIKVVVNPASSV